MGISKLTGCVLHVTTELKQHAVLVMNDELSRNQSIEARAFRGVPTASHGLWSQNADQESHAAGLGR